MEHDIAQLHLSEFLEGGLPPAERQALEAHLAGCAECRASLALLERTLRAVRGLPRVEAPPQFAARLRRRAAQAGLVGGRRRRRAHESAAPFASTMVLTVLLAAVGALLVLVLVFQQRLELLVERPPPAVVHLARTDDLPGLTRAAWQVGGEVRMDGRRVPAGSPLLGAALEVDLEVPAARWGDFLQLAREAGVRGPLPAEAPGVEADGRAHFLVAPEAGR
jgi:predicted anti-sigma-YlaC factor YlaD